MDPLRATSRFRRAAAGMLCGLLAACAGGDGSTDASASGLGAPSVRFFLTDAPADLERLWVTVEGLEVKKSGGPWVAVPLTTAGADADGDGRMDVIPGANGSVTVDLLALEGVETLFGSGVLGPGHYNQLRLRVLSAEAEDVGGTVPVEVPSGARTGVKIIGEFDVEPDEPLALLLDFDAEESLVDRGRSGKPLLLKPTIRLLPRRLTVARTWGRNVWGQLGDGTNLDRQLPVHVIDPSDPWGLLTDVVEVESGQHHSLALLRDGTIRAWARGDSGQLGNGSHANTNVPVRVADPADPSGLLREVTSIAAGGFHTLALLEDGTVRGWGLNRAGQLGDGTRTNRNLPVQVKDPSTASGRLQGVVAIAAGGGGVHSLALLSDGTVRAWGLNHRGQLGDGSPAFLRTRPVEVVDPMGPTGRLEEVVGIAAGQFHTLALLEDGTVRAWGANGFGQLGDGTNTSRNTPVAVLDPDDPSGLLTGVAAIAADSSHSLALMEDGTVRAWGLNGTGQLGDGTFLARSTPVRVVDPATPSGSLTGVKAIAAGFQHSVALMEDGTMRAWGFNIAGQLGDGTTAPSNVPVQVRDPDDPSGFLTGVKSISGGGAHTVAVE